MIDRSDGALAADRKRNDDEWVDDQVSQRQNREPVRDLQLIVATIRLGIHLPASACWTGMTTSSPRLLDTLGKKTCSTPSFSDAVASRVLIDIPSGTTRRNFPLTRSMT